MNQTTRARPKGRIAFTCLFVTGGLTACGGGGSTTEPAQTPAQPAATASAYLDLPTTTLFPWNTAVATSVTLKDASGKVIAPAQVSCIAQDAAQASVSSDCSSITARRVGDIKLTVSGAGISAALLITGVPQRRWTGLHGAASSEGGGDFSSIVKPDGSLLSWGANTSGVLAQNKSGIDLVSVTYPVAALNSSGSAALASVYQASVGYSSALALQQDGTVWAWGSNARTELGRSDFVNGSTLPVAVRDTANTNQLNHIVQVETGDESGVALVDDGSVVSWGAYPGTGTTTASLPNKVSSVDGLSKLSQIVAVSAGTNFTLALGQNGKVYAWGYDLQNGRLGAGATSNTPSKLPNTVKKADGSELTDIVQISAGYNFSLALAADGTVWAWGDDSWGQLGQNKQEYNGVPYAVQVKAASGTGQLTHIVMVAAGGIHALALTDTGAVLSWGYGANSQLGDGPTRPRGDFSLLPAPVVGSDGTTPLSGVASIAGGYSHSLALLADGRILSWGHYLRGALGRDTGGKDAPTPAPVQAAVGSDLSLAPLASYTNLLARAR